MARSVDYVEHDVDLDFAAGGLGPDQLELVGGAIGQDLQCCGSRAWAWSKAAATTWSASFLTEAVSHLCRALGPLRGAALFHDNESLQQQLDRGASAAVAPIRPRGPRQCHQDLSGDGVTHFPPFSLPLCTGGNGRERQPEKASLRRRGLACAEPGSRSTPGHLALLPAAHGDRHCLQLTPQVTAVLQAATPSSLRVRWTNSRTAGSRRQGARAVLNSRT